MSRRISDERNETLQQRHRVEKPEKNILKDIGDTLKETFFHDDPLRNFKGQPTSKKMLVGLQAVFPIFDWGRGYTLGKLKSDLIAGMTIASLCIPQVNLTNLYILLTFSYNINFVYLNLCILHVCRILPMQS